MYVKAKNYDSAIQKVKIEIGTLVGLESDEEAFLTLREMSTFNTMKLRDSAKADKDSVINFFYEVMPEIIVDHNLYITEQKKMTNEEVRDFIFEKIELSTLILQKYSAASFFIPRKKSEDK